MNAKPRRVVNRMMAARSVVRLIEDVRAPEPDAPVNIILKPKEKKKRLPGTALLIKIQKQKEKERAKKQAERADRPKIDEGMVDNVMAGIFEDLGI